MIFFPTVLAIAAQMVTVELLSPRPVCPNQVLVYNCQVEFLSLSIPEFGTLGFIASDDAVGTTRMTSDGRAVANLTVNQGIVTSYGGFHPDNSASTE